MIYWIYQVYVILVLISAGFISKFAASKAVVVFNMADPVMLAMVVAGCIYLSFVFILLWYRPALAGIERDQIQSVRIWIGRPVKLV